MPGGGGILRFGLDGGVPGADPGFLRGEPEFEINFLEKKTHFPQLLGVLHGHTPEILEIWKNRPIFNGIFVKSGTHV